MQKKSCHDLFLPTNVPVVYMARDFDPGKFILRAIGRGGPWNWDFFGTWNGNERIRCHLSPKEKRFAHIKIFFLGPYKKQVHWHFMYMSSLIFWILWILFSVMYLVSFMYMWREGPTLPPTLPQRHKMNLLRTCYNPPSPCTNRKWITSHLLGAGGGGWALPPPTDTVLCTEQLKVVGNEKEGGSRRWQMIGIGLRPRRSRFVCLIILLLSLILSISVSAPVKKNEKAMTYQKGETLP